MAGHETRNGKCITRMSSLNVSGLQVHRPVVSGDSSDLRGRYNCVYAPAQGPNMVPQLRFCALLPLRHCCFSARSHGCGGDGMLCIVRRGNRCADLQRPCRRGPGATSLACSLIDAEAPHVSSATRTRLVREPGVALAEHRLRLHHYQVQINHLHLPPSPTFSHHLPSPPTISHELPRASASF